MGRNLGANDTYMSHTAGSLMFMRSIGRNLHRA